MPKRKKKSQKSKNNSKKSVKHKQPSNSQLSFALKNDESIVDTKLWDHSYVKTSPKPSQKATKLSLKLNEIVGTCSELKEYQLINKVGVTNGQISNEKSQLDDYQQYDIEIQGNNNMSTNYKRTSPTISESSNKKRLKINDVNDLLSEGPQDGQNQSGKMKDCSKFLQTRKSPRKINSPSEKTIKINNQLVHLKSKIDKQDMKNVESELNKKTFSTNQETCNMTEDYDRSDHEEQQPPSEGDEQNNIVKINANSEGSQQRLHEKGRLPRKSNSSCQIRSKPDDKIDKEVIKPSKISEPTNNSNFNTDCLQMHNYSKRISPRNETFCVEKMKVDDKIELLNIDPSEGEENNLGDLSIDGLQLNTMRSSPTKDKLCEEKIKIDKIDFLLMKQLQFGEEENDKINEGSEVKVNTKRKSRRKKYLSGENRSKINDESGLTATQQTHSKNEINEYSEQKVNEKRTSPRKKYSSFESTTDGKSSPEKMKPSQSEDHTQNNEKNECSNLKTIYDKRTSPRKKYSSSETTSITKEKSSPEKLKQLQSEDDNQFNGLKLNNKRTSPRKKKTDNKINLKRRKQLQSEDNDQYNEKNECSDLTNTKRTSPRKKYLSCENESKIDNKSNPEGIKQSQFEDKDQRNKKISGEVSQTDMNTKISLLRERNSLSEKVMHIDRQCDDEQFVEPSKVDLQNCIVKKNYSKVHQPRTSAKKTPRKMKDKLCEKKMKIDDSSQLEDEQNNIAYRSENSEDTQPRINFENLTPKKQKSSENNGHFEETMDFQVPIVSEIHNGGDSVNIHPLSPDLSDIDDSDDDLPEFIEDTPTKCWNQLTEGDLVWAKAPRHPHWPAIIKSIKRNRARVVFVMEKNNETIFPIKNAKLLKPFSCPDKPRYEEDMKNELSQKEFKVIIQKAADYQEERVLRKNDIKNSAVEKKETASFNTDDDLYFDNSLPSPTVGPPSEDDNMSPSKEEIADDVIPDKYEEEIENEEEKRLEYEKTEVRIANYVKKSKKAKEHLIDIFTGKTKSERHTLFHQMTKSSRARLGSMGAYPILSEEVLCEITFRVKAILEEYCKLDSSFEVGPSYIANVAIPEAILFAIKQTRRVGKKKAEEIFYEVGAELIRLERGGIPKVTVDDEMREQTIRRAYRKLNMDVL